MTDQSAPRDPATVLPDASRGPVRLLLVDDEPSIREPLADYLTGQGFAVTAVGTAADARRALTEATVDLVICDIMMPGEDGLSLTRFIRQSGALPVILLTARAEDTEKIVGLEIGADDYVVKPFNPRELVARIRSVLRRAEPGAASGAVSTAPGTRFVFGPWTLAEEQRALHHRDGTALELSNGEFRLLAALVRHPRQILSRDQLLDQVRGREADVFDRAIDNLVSRLRRKMESGADRPRLIKTVWGGGYSLACDVRKTGGAA